MSRLSATPWHIVKSSAIHGRGVFARRAIAAGTCVIEYRGRRISQEQATPPAIDGQPLNLTYFFNLNDGRVIDGGRGGNDARFINHSCEPNCEAFEHADGRVFIYAMRDIPRGQELSYDYALIYEERHTPAVKRAFACHCGAEGCSGSMLMPKKSARYRANVDAGRKAGSDKTGT
ncbi:MAG TPA: SET domain-containing protein-lysine N-methyltransferase [Oxalicibacterium sp.]|nr:SET domain-containing protein-lysine N-methyltransferase [Oxalicibacterium sp.]